MNELSAYRDRMKRATKVAGVLALVLLAVSFVVLGVANGDYARDMARYGAYGSYSALDPLLTAAFAEARVAGAQSVALPLLVLGVVSMVTALICLTLCLVADLMRANGSSSAPGSDAEDA